MVIRYMFSETLGRWYTVDLVVGLAYLAHRESPDEYPAADIAAQGNTISLELNASESMILNVSVGACWP